MHTTLHSFLESRAQLEIPFGGSSGKPWHVNFIDALEELGKPGHVEHGAVDAEEYLTDKQNVIDAIKYQVQNSGLASSLLYGMYSLCGEPDDDDDDDDWHMDETAAVSKLKELDGYELYELYSQLDYEENYILEAQAANGGKGYVTVYRMLDVTPMPKIGDEYDVVKTFGGLGQYWTPFEDKAEAYWGQGGPNSVILTALVSKDDIDWETTIQLAFSDLHEERELRVKSDSMLELVNVKFEQGDRSTNWQPSEPMLYSAGHKDVHSI